MRSEVKTCVQGVAVCASVLLVLTGCGEPVRQDRTIEFSADGKQVAFEHGTEGVYVASQSGTEVKRIFHPAPDVLATSRPMAHPRDGRLVFTTAVPLKSSEDPATKTVRIVPAEGQIVTALPVRYTCWLAEPVAEGAEPAEATPAVRELFTATCSHPGYVSAGLAVRWHPAGDRLLYVAAVDDANGPHALFEYSLSSGQSRRAAPFSAQAMLCDVTPGGHFVVCVLGNQGQTAADRDGQGIWIGAADGDPAWWHVPGSQLPPEGELPSLLESLRASRPAWSNDDARFAFVASSPPGSHSAEQDANRQRIDVVRLADRSTVTALEGPTTFRDLHWSPDGKTLGFISAASDSNASLKIWRDDGTIVTLPVERPVRKFAGFNVSGRLLAYVVPQLPEAVSGQPQWSLLLSADPRARDSVWIAPADASEAGREVFRDMQVTFPRWSPAEDRLSLWLTFAPRYRSLVSRLLGWGLRPGDPAATLDSQNGEVAWMAVTPGEEFQVGHRHLLRREYGEAWNWYERARARLPKSEKPADSANFLSRLGHPEEARVFEMICLEKLGREDEARQLEEELRSAFQELLRGATRAEAVPGPDPILAQLASAGELVTHLLLDLYVAEVFLSVDHQEEALAYFRRERPESTPDAKLSRLLVLSQVLLIRDDAAEFAALWTREIAPAVMDAESQRAAKATGGDVDRLRDLMSGLALAPLFSREFVEQYSAEAAGEQVLAWTALRERAAPGAQTLAVDLVLRAFALRQDDQSGAAEAERRLAANPANEYFREQSVDEVIAGWFSAVHDRH